MGLNDAREQLEACKADAIRYEHRIRDLEHELATERALHDEAAHRRRTAERDAVILCRYCGERSDTLPGILTHLDEARKGPLGHLHHDKDTEETVTA